MCVTFTSVTLFLYTIAHIVPWEEASAVCIPLLWGVVVSFGLAGVLDSTVYVRMRKDRGWSLATFHSGNVILHYLQLAVPPPLTRRLTHWDGFCAAVLQLTWAAIVSDGGLFVLDSVYVPMRPWMWRTCLLASTLTEILIVPACYGAVW